MTHPSGRPARSNPDVLTPAQKRELAAVVAAGAAGLAGGSSAELRLRRDLESKGLVRHRRRSVEVAGAKVAVDAFAATPTGIRRLGHHRNGPMRPDFIVFTGADDATPIEALRRISADYPIEWAILFSPKRQGSDPRYPSPKTLQRLQDAGLRLAAHLCGAYADAVMEGRDPELPVPLGPYSRLQINHAAPDPALIAAYSARVGVPCIAQARGEAFPDDDRVQWLFDASGGRGIAPKAWPRHPGRAVGYAGGLSPTNVVEAIKAIAATGPYWIDMESGVRTDDRFDLDRVVRVCEAVY